MTLRDIIYAQIKHEETDFIPYEFRLERNIGNMLTEYFHSDEWRKNIIYPFCYGPFDFDTWGVLRQIDSSDPSKKTDPFGCLWTQTEHISHLDRCAMHNVAPQDYVWPKIDEFYGPERAARLQEWCKNLPNNQFSILNMGAGYWEHSWRLLGVEDALILTIDDPDTFDYILDHLDNMFHQFLDIMGPMPADAILLSDDWCDQRTCTMGIDRWRKHLKPRLEKIYKKIHDYGKIAITHVCGNVTPLLGDLVEIGLDVLESVQPEAMNPYEVKKQFGDKITFYGGLGCQHTLTYATPEEVRNEIRQLRREMSRCGGYILSSAKPINRVVPIENIVAAYNTFVEDNYKFLG